MSEPHRLTAYLTHRVHGTPEPPEATPTRIGPALSPAARARQAAEAGDIDTCEMWAAVAQVDELAAIRRELHGLGNGLARLTRVIEARP